MQPTTTPLDGAGSWGASRRAVLCAGGGALLLAGCGGGGTDAGSAPSGPASTAASTATTTPGATGTLSSAPPAAGALAAVADVPVGGSLAAEVDGKPVVLAQPTAGTVVCWSAVCTHQGCTVAAGGAKLPCPCHGSVFDAATGAVVRGPARRALPAVPVTVQGGQVVRAWPRP